MGKLKQVEYSLRKTGLGVRRGYDKETLKGPYNSCQPRLMQDKQEAKNKGSQDLLQSCL